MISPPELILAAESDWKSISEMMKDFCVSEGYPYNEIIKSEYFREFIVNPVLGRCWKIELNDIVSGYIILTTGFSFEHGKDAFIDEFYLKEEYRNQGIGTKVLELTLEQCKRLAIQTVHLEVEQNNPHAARLYANMGFKSNGRILLSNEVDSI